MCLRLPEPPLLWRHSKVSQPPLNDSQLQILNVFIYRPPLDAKVKVKVDYTRPQSRTNPYNHEVLLSSHENVVMCPCFARHLRSHSGKGVKKGVTLHHQSGAGIQLFGTGTNRYQQSDAGFRLGVGAPSAPWPLSRNLTNVISR
jgi:hypothetical protein